MPCDNFDRSHLPGEPEPFPLSGNLCHTCKSEQRMHGDETTENGGAEQAEVEVNIRFTPALWNTIYCKFVQVGAHIKLLHLQDIYQEGLWETAGGLWTCATQLLTF